MFVISSVSVRWGFRATMLVTIVLALLYPSVFYLASHTIGSEVGFRRVHLIRPIYLLTLAYLIGYLGEHERRSKRKLGFKNKEVGNALAISERTVKTHLTNIFQKLGVRDRVGLVMFALRRGLTRAA